MKAMRGGNGKAMVMRWRSGGHPVEKRWSCNGKGESEGENLESGETVPEIFFVTCQVENGYLTRKK